MASLPSQPSASQRPSSSQQSPPSPTHTLNRRPSRSSQSLTSEDSQTLLVNTPRSTSPKPASPKATDDATTPPPLSSPANSEPRKCWICFSDETEDNPTTSEWVSPCPCALTAHQACLLDWVADLQAPNRKAAKKVQCPQCKADIKVAQPRSLSLELARAFDRISSRLWKGVAGASFLSAFIGVCYMHGCSSLYIMMGRSDYTRLVMSHRRSSSLPSLETSISLIPIVLVLSRTTLADGLLPVLPVLFLFRSKPARSVPTMWPPSFMMTLYSLPYIRSLYNAFHKQVLAPYEKAWLKGIQPRASEDAEEADAEAQQEDGAEADHDDGEGDMVDFELGVQVEVIEEEDV
ncbi:MAG: hypothetical protein Q9191_007125, partial [Dirinaria sp. TL-2023a]